MVKVLYYFIQVILVFVAMSNFLNSIYRDRSIEKRVCDVLLSLVQVVAFAFLSRFFGI